jgi:serine/threonine protein kinase
MQAAHQVKIIHWDLKPPNVLSSDTGIVKIVDFGCTAAVSALRAADDVFDLRSLAISI